MEAIHRVARWSVLALCALILVRQIHGGEREVYLYRPEARRIEVRDPARLPRVPLPPSTAPRTVVDPQPGTVPWYLSLDEAIRIALANSEVVRILTGASAVSSGSTIYDPAVTNTTIDVEQAVFDPVLSVNNAFNQNETPTARFSAVGPPTVITGSQVESYDVDFGLSKRFITGAEFRYGALGNTSRFSPGVFPLNPQDTTANTLSLSQPLLQGAGPAANLAPIVIARIETERSYFQLKASVQDMVRGVIEGYWNLVFARTNTWATRQQVEQSQFALERAEARMQEGFADVAEVSQTRVALVTFRANLIAAEANQLTLEAALRNIMGLPPNDMRVLIPTTPPREERVELDWDQITQLAEQRRPDIIELKLILEADQQRLILARNQALPRLDAVALYRWNGLEGRMPDNTYISTTGSDYTDWTLGVNFSVPLGLRQSRAGVRRVELVIDRDRANLMQGLHATSHTLAADVRQYANSYAQYQAFRTVREAALVNLEQQFAEYSSGRAIFLNVLDAISDWGSAVSSEAQTLVDSNTVLANIERDTGTILETHGVRFFEERYSSLGPIGLGRLATYYPQAEVPSGNLDIYPNTDRPAEDFFNLKPPVTRDPEDVAPPAETLPLPAPLPGPAPAAQDNSQGPVFFRWLDKQSSRLAATLKPATAAPANGRAPASAPAVIPAPERTAPRYVR